METEQLYKHFIASKGVTTDTRSCSEGMMFFALRGERFNGNSYAQTALDAGCAFAVMDDASFYNPNEPRMLKVDDTLVALQQLARYHRRQTGTTIIGITGTNGKTTTKELIAAVLERKYHILYTQGNLNNAIGVPLTLLRLDNSHELAVIEMGASHPGDIRELVDIAEPNCGLITNVGRAHLQGFGSFEGVIKTKGELYDKLRETPDSFIFLHSDNPYLGVIAKGLKAIKYGSDKEAEVTGEVIECNPCLHCSWTGMDGIKHNVRTSLVGRYNIDNVLCAAAVGQHFGVSGEDIDAALEAYQPTNSRSQLVRTEANTLIVDAYNANPTSMRAALENFAQMEAADKRIIIGDMKELGAESEKEHLEILQLAKELHFNEVWTVGENFVNPLFAFRNFKNAEEVIETLKADKPRGATILVKGSNSMHLATIVPYL